MRGRPRCWSATYNFRTGGFRIVELAILANTRKGFIVEDGEGQDILVKKLNKESPDCVAVVTDEPLADIRAELEEKLRLKMAHRNICEPHILLKEEEVST